MRFIGLRECERARLFNYFNTMHTHGVYRENAAHIVITSAGVPNIFADEGPLTYLIYHPEGVPVYGGNLIRERKMCPRVCARAPV